MAVEPSCFDGPMNDSFPQRLPTFGVVRSCGPPFLFVVSTSMKRKDSPDNHVANDSACLCCKHGRDASVVNLVEMECGHPLECAFHRRGKKFGGQDRVDIWFFLFVRFPHRAVSTRESVRCFIISALERCKKRERPNRTRVHQNRTRRSRPLVS